ncbi:hypothetical protein TWF694_000982 [Orbilia ellipsospora]|uniref:Uncharacterized protein n=1 Tax=Orbilia ellipsospora TaxID=2528407 RepID=A0AAV9XQA6_9PEZI
MYDAMIVFENRGIPALSSRPSFGKLETKAKGAPLPVLGICHCGSTRPSLEPHMRFHPRPNKPSSQLPSPLLLGANYNLSTLAQWKFGRKQWGLPSLIECCSRPPKSPKSKRLRPISTAASPALRGVCQI